MLAFDLETTGLDFSRDSIICAGVYDPAAGVDRVFFFVSGEDPEEFMRLLDAASSLCAFNGAAFDIPFIAAQFKPTSRRVMGWRMKLHDAFVACKWGLGITFPLQDLLLTNGFPGKTGTGCGAVDLFRQGLLDQLGEYCMNDTRMTHAVSTHPALTVPRCTGVQLRVSDGSFFSLSHHMSVQ